jgi:hypothetical protein
MNIVVFDPGKTTGVVEIINGEISLAYSVEREELMDNLIREKYQYTFQAIVAEEFRLYPWSMKRGQSFAVLYAPLVLGMLEFYAYKHNMHYQIQWAAHAKKYATDKLLKEVGWWEHVKNDHERDAARHALFFMKFNASTLQGKLELEEKND